MSRIWWSAATIRHHPYRFFFLSVRASEDTKACIETNQESQHPRKSLRRASFCHFAELTTALFNTYTRTTAVIDSGDGEGGGDNKDGRITQPDSNRENPEYFHRVKSPTKAEMVMGGECAEHGKLLEDRYEHMPLARVGVHINVQQYKKMDE